MKSAIETVSPTRVRLTVEVPFEELTPSVGKAYKTIGRQIAIPGFRKGKVPARLIDQRVGRAAVLEEAVNDALPGFYSQAIAEHHVHVLGQPDVDVTEFAEDADLKFTAEVDVRPEIVLPDLSELSVTVEDAEVDDTAVDEEIEHLRERFGTLNAVDRAVADGDFVSIDLAASIDGEVLEDGSANGLSYQVGSGGMVEGLDEAIIGLDAGGATTFATALAGGPHAGEQAEIAVTVDSVKVRELPELDDEFAQLASEFDTLDELKADVRSRLEKVKTLEQGTDARDKALEALLERVDVPVPPALLAAELDMRRQTMVNQLEMSGMTKQAFLESEGQTEEEFDAEVAQRAEEAIKAQFVLDAVVETESIGVTEAELSEHLIRRAMRANVSPDEFAQQVVANNQVPALVSEVVRGKALALVLERTTVTDASGRPVDLMSLTSGLITPPREDETEAEVVEVADREQASPDTVEVVDTASE